MRNFKYCLLIFVIVSFFLSLTLRATTGVPTKADILGKLKETGSAFETSQERARYALTQSFVDEKTFQMDKVAELALPDISYKNDHYYSVFPPGLSAIIAPAYMLGKLINEPVITTFAMPALASIFTAIFIFLILVNFLKVSRASSFIAAIIFPLATTAWSYSVTLYAHTFSALCLVSLIYFVLRAKNGSILNYLLAWLIYGISILIDFPNAVILLPAIIFMVIESFKVERMVLKDRVFRILNINFTFLYTILPLFVIIAALAYYNIKTFGSWHEIAHSYRVTSLVNGPIDYQFLISKAMDIKFIENGLFTLILSKSRGILLFCPVLILGILGFAKLSSEKVKIASLFASMIFLNLAVYASFYDPWGGWAYGPRYLIVTMPILAILVGTSYEQYKKYSLYILFFTALFFASFGIALLGALTTNLLPPAAETGKQIGFLSLLPRLFSDLGGGILYLKAKELFNLRVIEYFVILTGSFVAIFLPIFLNQVVKNIARLFIRKKNVVLTVLEQETNAN